jgi:hypothetical protein
MQKAVATVLPTVLRYKLSEKSEQLFMYLRDELANYQPAPRSGSWLMASDLGSSAYTNPRTYLLTKSSQSSL